MNIYKTLSVATVAAIGTAYGGVPLNNLQGAGGIAFNPLAYTASQPWEGGESNSLNNVVSKPQFGAWYVNLNEKDINWWAAGAAFSVANCLEVPAGYGFINAHKYGDKSINTYNVGAKLIMLKKIRFTRSEKMLSTTDHPIQSNIPADLFCSIASRSLLKTCRLGNLNGRAFDCLQAIHFVRFRKC